MKNNLKIQDDIVISKYFSYKNKPDLYVIASEKGDVSFYFEETNLEVIRTIVELFDGNNSIEDIECKAKEQFPGTNTNKLIKKILSSNLIDCNDEKRNSNSELSRTSIIIKEISLDFINYIPESVFKTAYVLIALLMILGVVLDLYQISIGERFKLYDLYLKANGYSISFFKIMFAAIIGSIFHEIGHIVMGKNNNINPKSIGISLYLDFIPQIYVKSSKIYLANRKERFLYHIGGPSVDFIFFSYFSFAGLSLKSSTCILLSLAALQSLIFNLMPFGLSDGYFIMSVIFKTINLRINFVNLLSFQFKKVKWTITNTIYYLLSFVYIVVSSFLISYWIIGIISDFINTLKWHNFLIVLVTIILIVQVFIISYIRTKKTFMPTKDN